ncbi:MAG: uroporphyrinogen decarboxylase family protein, partial [Pseudomonadota bacterium]
EGPRMRPLETEEVAKIDTSRVTEHLAPVFETLRRLRVDLPDETTLLGFCGAPWTVATYMIAGRGTSDQAPSRLWLYRESKALEHLLDKLVDASIAYLIKQVDAGADAVKIFDSWSGVLDRHAFEACCVKPVKRIIDGVKSARPGTPVIAFPKGAGFQYRGYREKTGADMIALDWTVPLDIARELQAEGPVQGNLDPMRVVAGREAISEGVDRIMEALRDGPFVFNLGHGITPEANPDDMGYLVKYVRGEA